MNLDVRARWMRVAALLRPHLVQAAGAVACIAAGAGIGVLPALITRNMIDVALPHHNFHAIAVDVAKMAAAAIAVAALSMLDGAIEAKMGYAITRDLRTRLVRHIHDLPIAFFTKTHGGEIMNRVTGDIDSTDGALLGVASGILTNILAVASSIVAMFLVDWRLAIVSFLIIPLMLFPASAMGTRMYHARRSVRERHDVISTILGQTVTLPGVFLVKSFGRQFYESTRIHKAGEELMHRQVGLAMIGQRFQAAVACMLILGPAAIWLAGGYLVTKGSLSVGVIVAFLALLSRLYAPASALLSVRLQFAGVAAIFDRIFEYLEIPAEVDAHQRESSSTAAVLKGDIRFRDVSFSYGDESPVLKSVSFKIAAGQTAALVGRSGAGKTTIANLIPRFFAPYSGRIEVDGIDIGSMPLDVLRENIGIVSQETYLFHDTIAQNIRYAKLDATKDEIEAAARTANIHDIIVSLPQGYETIVGERGYRLSGGERQRVALARVVLKNPRILILDEATSALDSENETIIQEAMLRVMLGRTSVVIAHRMSTIAAADVICVIDNGCVSESGRHEELLARGGRYSALCANGVPA